MTHWAEELEKIRACQEAIDWAKGYPSLEEAWMTCERGDWMLWLAGKCCETDGDRRQLDDAACGCARLALPYVTPGESRPLKSIETAEKWARGGEVSRTELAFSVVAAYAAHASYAAHAATLQTCADIVRQHYPHPPELRKT